jgi:hypothetical protein
VVSVIDSTVVAICVGVGALAGAIVALWNVLIGLDRVEKEAVILRKNHDRLSAALEPLAGVPDAVNDIRAQLRILLAELVAARRR